MPLGFRDDKRSSRLLHASRRTWFLAGKRGPLKDELRIGLCLSGGGFRAAFYSFGVLRYLAEAGRLSDVVAISAVSGGSIAAAALADRAERLAVRGATEDAFLEEVHQPFFRSVTQRSLRNRWLFRSALSPLRWGRSERGSVLADTLGAELYNSRKLSSLRTGPQVIFTSTDLASGRAFRFSRDFVGSFDIGYTEPAPDSVELGLAVAASAALPTVFPPVTFRATDLDLVAEQPTLTLVDGGVYDNLGLEWFQGWDSGRPTAAEEPTFLIVVNASAPLSSETPSLGRLARTLRSHKILYSQTTSLRVRWFVRDLNAGRERGIYLGIRHDPRAFQTADGRPIDSSVSCGALPSDLIPALAALRTDLDRFRVEEADLLSYHGYWSMHTRLACFYPELAVAKPHWRDYESMPQKRVGDLSRLLTAGSKRRLLR